MIYSSERILPEGCCIIYKTYENSKNLEAQPKFKVNFNDNQEDNKYSLLIQSFLYPEIEDFPKSPGKIEWMVSNIHYKNPGGDIIVPYNYEPKEKGKAYIYYSILTKQNEHIKKDDMQMINHNLINFINVYYSFNLSKYKVLDTFIIENNNNQIELFRESDIFDSCNTLKNPLKNLYKNILNNSSKSFSELIN